MGEGDVDFLRKGLRVFAEVAGLTGVAKGERDPERRVTRRNAYRDRQWDTPVREEEGLDRQGP